MTWQQGDFLTLALVVWMSQLWWSSLHVLNVQKQIYKLTNKHLYKLIYQLQEVTYQQSNIAPCENPEVSKLALVIGWNALLLRQNDNCYRMADDEVIFNVLHFSRKSIFCRILASYAFFYIQIKFFLLGIPRFIRFLFFIEGTSNR